MQNQSSRMFCPGQQWPYSSCWRSIHSSRGNMFHHTPILCLADDGSFDLNCRQSIYMASLVELSGIIDGGLLNGKWRWLHCIFEMGICHICNVIYQPIPGSWLGLIAWSHGLFHLPNGYKWNWTQCDHPHVSPCDRRKEQKQAHGPKLLTFSKIIRPRILPWGTPAVMYRG